MNIHVLAMYFFNDDVAVFIKRVETRSLELVHLSIFFHHEWEQGDTVGIGIQILRSLSPGRVMT